MLTNDEVIWGYRYTLGRDPESSLVLENHLRSHGDWRQFRERLLASNEFLHAQRGRTLPPKWVATEILQGQRLLWLDLEDAFVSRGCLMDGYEPVETAFVRAQLREGGVFLDIGANIGWFTMLASTIVGERGHVHAFEPRKPTVDYLRRSVEANALSDLVTVHEVGLADKAGQWHLAWAQGTTNPGSSCLVADESAANLNTIAISLQKLDDLELSKVDFVKIDIEGAEMLAMNGGSQTIARHRPVVMSELHPKQLQMVSGATPVEYIGWFTRQGYRVFLLEGGRNDELDNFPDFLNKELVNIVCIPPDRAELRFG
ncbi:MAG: FkbM family methyltransferase [Pseudomonadota bacterium]